MQAHLTVLLSLAAGWLPRPVAHCPLLATFPPGQPGTISWSSAQGDWQPVPILDHGVWNNFWTSPQAGRVGHQKPKDTNSLNSLRNQSRFAVLCDRRPDTLTPTSASSHPRPALGSCTHCAAHAHGRYRGADLLADQARAPPAPSWLFCVWACTSSIQQGVEPHTGCSCSAVAAFHPPRSRQHPQMCA